MKNKVQVFGLQRSGTNFIEYSLRNNFIDLEYDSTLWKEGNVKGDSRFGLKQSVKHCLPECESAELAILIQRDYNEWNDSVKRTFSGCTYTKETYEYYYDTPYRENWDKSSFLHFNHKWVVLNYYEFLSEVSNRLGVKIKEDWKQPTKRLHWDGGKTLLSTDYNINVKIT